MKMSLKRAVAGVVVGVLAGCGSSATTTTDGGTAGAAGGRGGAAGGASGATGAAGTSGTTGAAGRGGATGTAGSGAAGGAAGTSGTTGVGGGTLGTAGGGGRGGAGGSSGAAGSAGRGGQGGLAGQGGSAGQGGLAGSVATTYANPVIPGFHPDPSIVRVGDDYYLATSSFEYFPGVPIFHSRDLTHWRQIGHALTRASQVPLATAKSSEGIFAPTLRHNNGTFYMIANNVGAGGNFFVTATDPAGEWSEPTRITGDSQGGIDPSLFFDDDGKVYFTRQGGGERGGIYQAQIDLATGRCAAEPTQIWAGTGGVWPEGPHLYKIGQRYYLMISEGGTSYGHMVTIARASVPNGPFEAFPDNPILTHSNLSANPIQATGHADLVQLPDSSWWTVFLAIRPWDRSHHHIGRETFLAPVTWDAAGWPAVNNKQPIALEMSTAGLPPQQAAPVRVVRDEFTATRLGFDWNLLRNPPATLYSLSARPGFLRLAGTRASLDAVGTPAFVGRRQEHLRARISARLDFTADVIGQQAGLTVRANEANHYDLAVITAGGPRVRLLKRLNGTTTTTDMALSAGPVVLTIETYQDRYDFYVASPATSAARLVGTATTTPLSSETAGGFTGVYIGMYAFAGDADTMPPADFDWFEYQPN